MDFDEIMDIINKKKEEFQSQDARFEELNREIDSIKRNLSKLVYERNQITSSKMRLRNEITEMEREKRAAERKKQLEEEQEQLRIELLAKTKELDEITKTAYWREWAKDKQIEGGKILAIAKRGILADKRGLGKTLTSLIYADMVQAKKILVICINDVVPQFEQEIQTWAKHRQIIPLAGLNPTQRKVVYPMIKMLDQYIITINYEAWRRDKTVIDDLVDAGLDTVILDEAHRAKTAQKMTAQGIFHLVHAPNYCQNCGVSSKYYGSWYNKEWEKPKPANPNQVYYCPNCGTVLQSTIKNVLSATGTPILNKPQELFPLLYLNNPETFPSEKTYLRDYCYQTGPNKWAFAPGSLKRLTTLMGRSFLQRDRADFGIEIPPPARKVYELELNSATHPLQYKARKDLNEAAALALQNTDEVYSMTSIIEVINRERQVMSWPAGINFRDKASGKILCSFDVEESVKVDAVVDLARDLIEEGERFLIFSQFKSGLREIKTRLNHSVDMATGDDSKEWRNKVRDDFDLKTASKDNYQWSGALCTYKAFGVGVNLNAARHVIILDHEWNPGMEDQAIGRIDRLNSTDQATVHEFYVKSSIDTFMRKLIEHKRNLVGGFEGSVSITAKDLLKGIQDGEI